ncbi:MAG: hypothetical protein ABJA75_01680, partial [Bradyrhizobium sp.]
NMPFWKMIKEGYDHFEVTKQEPRVDFCEKKYVFDAIKAPNATRELVFDASAKCPAYAISDDVADAVREKQATDLAETAKLIARGTPVARINTGIDGGMNKVFAARVPEGNTGLSEGGDSQGLSMLALSRAPGTIPSTVNPPRASASPSDNLLQGAPEEPRIAVAPAPTAGPTRVANAAPTAQNDGFFSSLARKVGIGGSADATATASTHPQAAPRPKVIEARRTEAPRPEATLPKPAAPKAVAARPALKPSVSDAPAHAVAPAPSQVAGSAPIVSSNSFDSRFGAVK